MTLVVTSSSVRRGIASAYEEEHAQDLTRIDYKQCYGFWRKGGAHYIARVGQFLCIVGRVLEDVGCTCEARQETEDGAENKAGSEEEEEEEEEQALMQKHPGEIKKACADPPTNPCDRDHDDSGGASSSNAAPRGAGANRGRREEDLSPEDVQGWHMEDFMEDFMEEYGGH